ncbi:hypothetical protein KZJ38_33235 [Paraburkholderia edwinii]|uniref:Uncharacterized protein n=1 Tax=Paraburkholderia edwinii TaxID=2861782 RepID=A0ABX8US45_9BURK|nr:hypothetical protein [Paraburkholderia edwinii]QYD71834.1 hypothetical protein KZJ38_33235 [Paraburkholderia edwinii]
MIVQGISGVASTAAAGANPNTADTSANTGAASNNANGSAGGTSGSADSQTGAPGSSPASSGKGAGAGSGAANAGGVGGIPGLGGAAGSGSGNGSGNGSGKASSAIQQLDALVERLKAELAQVQQQIAVVARQRVPGGGPNPAMNALQSEAHLIEGAILSAASELAGLVMKQGQTTGGVIDTQA